MEKIDILNRNEDVDRLLKIIESFSIKKANTSFAINGDWGSGKTFLLSLLEESLETIQDEETANNKYLVFHYDCWKYDYYAEPILAIVASMLDTLDEKVSILSDEMQARVTTVLRLIGKTLFNMANTVVEKKTGIDVGNVFDEIKEVYADSKKNINNQHDFDIYFSFNKVLNSLRDTICELSEKYTIIFVVDELDRCLPSYAIKVLERLHHITTDLKNTINIIATDKKRLGKIITKTIGVDDINEYLKKFIRFEVALNTGETNEAIEMKFPTYFSLFEGDDKEEAFEFLHAFLRNTDIRSISHIIDLAEMVHTLKTDKKMDYSVMCMEILILILDSHNYNFDKNIKYVEVNHNNFLLTKQNSWINKSHIKDFLSTKSHPESWSRIQTVTGSWHHELAVNSKSTLYDKLCYYYSVIIGSISVKCTDQPAFNEENPQLIKNSNYLFEFKDFVSLIN